MLVELRIRNVAVIDTAVLPFLPGLNVLTGETGAGKSLVIGALSMLLGERATAELIRAGADRATVEGFFELPPGHQIFADLDSRGVEAGDGITIVLKREVMSTGRSRAWINGSSVTVGMLLEIGTRLVSVYGQQESRLLASGEHQRDMLDEYVQAADVRAEVKGAHERTAQLRRRERELVERRQEAARRTDYLRFVLREIAEAAPRSDECESLDSEIRLLSHAAELQILSSQAVDIIDGNEDSALVRLAALRRTITSMVRFDPDAMRMEVGLDNAVYALDELGRELQTYSASVDPDPSRLSMLERRREILSNLMRKYGPTVDEVQRTADDASRELALANEGDAELNVISAELTSLEVVLTEAARRLTALRSAGATGLASAVSALFPDLGMPDGRLEVRLVPLDGITADGAETVQFLAVLNSGMEPRLLGRIASGGELSRIMLALSTVLASHQQTPTLVFDEVDAGVGGAVAWQIGALMRRVAMRHQVFSVSHLAQIAARAHHHVVVHKGAGDMVTVADTSVAEGESRITEIARMLGGDSEREISRAHARELLSRADEPANESRRDDMDRLSSARPSRDCGGQRRGKPV